MSDTVRLYKFYGLENALRNIEDRRLKISTIEELNDPFEWYPYAMMRRKDRKAWSLTRKQANKGKGLVCFSESWSHPLMWSHYADSHRGLALGFDVSLTFVEKVQYVPSRPSIKDLSSSVTKMGPELVQQAFFSKAKFWEYEEEWRFFCSTQETDPTNGLFFKDFDSDLRLREVVIGANSSATSTEVREKAKNEKLVVTTARLAFHSFRVVKQLNRRLQK